MIKSIILTIVLAASTCLTGQASLVFSLSNTNPSTSTQLNFRASGTISASDFGSTYMSDPLPKVYIYIPGLEWISGSLNTGVNNASNGAGNTAPTIVGVNYVLTNSNVNGAFTDVIMLESSSLWDSLSDFQIGQDLDWTFSVRNFNIPAYDFNAFIAAAPSGISHQIGTGIVTPEPDPSAVPEPGQVAASLLLLGGIGGYVVLKRRKSAKSAVAIG